MKIKKFYILVCVLMVVLTGCGETSYLAETKTVSESTSEVQSVSAEQPVQEDIYVQIEGAVEHPGVYQMPPDSRVFSLIEKAGGFSKEAYTADINQAEPLSDGQKIIVQTKKEHKESGTKESGTGAAGDDRIDINTADVTALTTISGIGQAKADAIIAYRKENGRFKDTKDITKVSGIGESTYDRIKDRIKV